MFGKRNLPRDLIRAGNKLFGGETEWHITVSDGPDVRNGAPHCDDVDAEVCLRVLNSVDPVCTAEDWISCPITNCVVHEDLWGDEPNGPNLSVCYKQLPGCCGAVVFTGLQNNTGVRNKGYAEFLMKCAMYAAASDGYSFALATTVVELATTKMAESMGAVRVGKFKNGNSGNNIYVWSKCLPKPVK